MPPIILPNLLTPELFEANVLAVFREALHRLALQPTHIRCEKRLNLDLLRLAKEVRYERRCGFTIFVEPANQPEPDDVVGSPRLEKYPDFACSMIDDRASTSQRYELYFYIECKRLGATEGAWVLNRNYSVHGIDRFRTTEHGYGKGCASAAMIGYMQPTQLNQTILDEVNVAAANLTISPLVLGSNGWTHQGVTDITQDPLTREFDLNNPIRLCHLWVDLSHCAFVDPIVPPLKRPRTRKKKASSKEAAPAKPSKKPATNTKKPRTKK